MNRFRWLMVWAGVVVITVVRLARGEFHFPPCEGDCEHCERNHVA